MAICVFCGHSVCDNWCFFVEVAEIMQLSSVQKLVYSKTSHNMNLSASHFQKLHFAMQQEYFNLLLISLLKNAESLQYHETAKNNTGLALEFQL